jgi:23S rRNA (adenine2503-C2)-methyltransferase
VERLHDPFGFGLGARSMTVSTVGLVPGIRRLAGESLPVNLAISLHAPNDKLRGEMMPVNRRYPLADLLDATREYLERTNRRVSFEYVLLQGRNDEPAHAAELADLLRAEGSHGGLPQQSHGGLPLHGACRTGCGDRRRLRPARGDGVTTRCAWSLFLVLLAGGVTALLSVCCKFKG